RLAGGAGGVVSMVTDSGLDAGLVLPAASVALAVRLWTPSPRAAPRVMLQLPLPSTVAVGDSAVVPSNSCTVSPALALPVIFGLLKLVRLSPAVPESGLASSFRPRGAAAPVRMVRSNAAEAAPVLPATSVALAVRWCSPVLRAAPRMMLQLPL